MGESGQPQTRRILVVDDDYYVSDLLSAALGEQGYSVDVAVNARAVSRQLELHPPDLIILDIALPGMDGTEIGQLLRSDPSTAAIPVLLLSGDRNLQQKASRINIANWLPKPVDVNLLLAKVAAMLRDA